MKTGLILEGGAMRGMFTAGVMDVMMENDIVFDGAIGVSAGAAFGCNYKSKQIGRAARYNMKYCDDKRYCGIGSLIKTGNIFSTDFAYGEVPMKKDIFDFYTYKNNPMEFYVVCTDIESGKAVYHRYDDFSDHGFDWIRASASMPLVSEIVEIDGVKMLDGGVADSIPLKYFESIGYDRNVVILTRPGDYRKKKNNIIPLIKLKYKKYPEFVKAMEERHIKYNETLEYIAAEEQKGNVLVIRPDEALPVGRIEKNRDNLKAAYEIGRNTAIKKLDKVRKFLK
ncbi:MAG: patatin family protein [Lachnospiraceae bacterium]|nr:patatin family protein [Lachnospiraceae bacterium]